MSSFYENNFQLMKILRHQPFPPSINYPKQKAEKGASIIVKGRVRDLFPGGNTALGFFSYYDQIIGPDATRIFIIKGGPGVGKSSFMKEIAAVLNGQGFDVELHHCSSDMSSLDGVVFPQIGVAMIDGTSPHVVDPKNPGAVDEILHLGDFWNEAGMRRGKPEILALNREVGRLFNRAYRYLRAAKAVHDDLEAIYSEALDPGPANQTAAGLIDIIFSRKEINRKAGRIRKLFISAITPDGFINFLPGLAETMDTIYAVEGPPGSGKSTLVSKLAQAAVERGMDCEAFYCAFDPHQMEHLAIPALGVMVTTATNPHRIDLNRANQVIDMKQFLNPAIISSRIATIETDQSQVESLQQEAIATITQAKQVHDQMEQYYIPHMNFTAINDLRQRITERIMNYAIEASQDSTD
jgi:molybdopterin-guanine dinucleotide biosynthesis protein